MSVYEHRYSTPAMAAHDTAAMLAFVEPPTYRDAMLFKSSHGWTAICHDGVELGGDGYTRREVEDEIDGWLDGLPEPEVEVGEPMQTYIPHCNRVFL